MCCRWVACCCCCWDCCWWDSCWDRERDTLWLRLRWRNCLLMQHSGKWLYLLQWWQKWPLAGHSFKPPWWNSPPQKEHFLSLFWSCCRRSTEWGRSCVRFLLLLDEKLSQVLLQIFQLLKFQNVKSLIQFLISKDNTNS